MIRVAVVDDHPAVRVGLQAGLRGESGLLPVGSAGSDAQARTLLAKTRPDVVVLDFHLPDSDGLTVCMRIKADTPAPAVLLYSAFGDNSLAVPAIVAGADGMAHKTAPPSSLYEQVRRVARGERAHAPIPRALMTAAAAAVDADDLPILSMLFSGMPPAADIADAMRVPRAELRRRIRRVLTRLHVPAAGNKVPHAEPQERRIE